jgi:glycosyltransferase involved in cell wall biosynthesis
MSAPAARGRRVAVVAACPFPVPRGTPIRIRRISEALARRGHDVHVVTYHLGDPLTDPPFRVHRTRKVSSYRKLDPGPSYRKLLVMNPLLRGVLRRVVREHDIEVVHAHHYEGLLVALSLTGSERRPIVYDAHTLLTSELPYYSLGLPRGVKAALGRWLDRNLPGRAEHVIAVTDVIRDALVREGIVPPDRVTAISNGVEVERFPVPEETVVREPGPARAADPASRREADPPTVVFAGNLASYQGIDLLLRAFASAASRRPDARLVLLTDSPFDEYEPLAADLGIRDRIELDRVAWPDLPARLTSAGVAVSPRIRCDGIPQKLLNYMAAACPVVAFEGSAPVVEPEREGLVVPDGDTEALGAAMVRVLDDPNLAARLGAAARARAVAEHSWDRTAARVEEVFAGVLGAARSRSA